MFTPSQFMLDIKQQYGNWRCVLKNDVKCILLVIPFRFINIDLILTQDMSSVCGMQYSLGEQLLLNKFYFSWKTVFEMSWMVDVSLEKGVGISRGELWGLTSFQSARVVYTVVRFGFWVDLWMECTHVQILYIGRVTSQCKIKLLRNTHTLPHNALSKPWSSFILHVILRAFAFFKDRCI